MNKVIANGSMAHTIGNVTSFFTEFIKQQFPDNYFKYTHINTRMAYREQKKEENSKQEFIKKVKPILIVRPKVDLNNSDIFLYNSFLTTNVFGHRYTGSTTNMMPLYLDKNIGCQISYLLNRIRVIFECTIMLDTEFEQINQYAYLLNLFIPERIYRLNTALEMYIPNDILELVSLYSGVPIFDNDKGVVKPFLDYMMRYSNKYITYKERTSTSTKDFFVYYPLSIDYVFNDISKDDPNKKNWASYSCNINFTLTTEFNVIGLYEFFTNVKDDRLNSYQFQLGGNHQNDRANGINIIPHFTVPNLFDNIKLDNGFELFYSRSFETDVKEAGKESVLELSELMEVTNLKEVIAWHKKNGMPNSLYLQFIILSDNEKLSLDKDYTIDWDNLSINILNSDPDKTYRMNIYLNNFYINQLIENYNSITSSYEQQVGRVTDKTISRKRDNEVGIL